MSAIMGDLETDRQPPMTIPLAHFVVGFCFLLLGGLLGLVDAVAGGVGLTRLSHLHLLFVGWICLTIMGAMTQFVPVWSGVELHSRRLALAQLWLLTPGLVGFVTALLAGSLDWLPLFGSVMLVGFWLFVYNVGRTLLCARPFDVTERHFAFALGTFLLLTILGVLLAIDFTQPLFGSSLPREQVLMAHATLAVFGAVLATVLGALYQLGTMFTQTSLHGIDRPLKRFEEVAYPTGVLALAAGRLVANEGLARIGGLLVVASVLAIGVILVRRLFETQVPWTPMLSRYAVVAVAMVLWALVTAPAWFDDPLARATLFGTESAHLLAFGVIGFVVLGTLYHVVPFIVWVHRYSDRLGYETVPMIDDLYDARVATADLVALVVGTGLLVVGERFAVPAAVFAVGGIAALVGFTLFVGNMLLVVRDHSPQGLGRILVPTSTLRESRAVDSRPEER
ncbi:hypothetical protein MUK72_03140 [Halococcus dombrowskii]|uniref:Uncharacterized protein n=1 Tax=Halococcus dombrowskii TaxID=179637 RepID=A0AAV3SFS5_HALDO|nr:hypothetical protein [Halococcus dombrowskii]UOO95710.1 hypothetical protein MUK72_03140 [Halococcus dombrowskii]